MRSPRSRYGGRANAYGSSRGSTLQRPRLPFASFAMSRRVSIQPDIACGELITGAVLTVWSLWSLQPVAGAPTPAPVPAVSDSIDLPLKNGTMYTFTCPSPLLDETNISAEKIKAAMAKVEGSLSAACGGKDFSSKDTCDMCWNTIIGEATNFLAPLLSNDAILKGIMADVEADSAILESGEVDFSNGCPWCVSYRVAARYVRNILALMIICLKISYKRAVALLMTSMTLSRIWLSVTGVQAKGL
jgi:hypothetical protein